MLIPCLTTVGHTATLYVTQAGAGDTDGSSCANALSIATFNSSASGGNTYVICSGETITTTIAPPTGSEGNVITLISEWEHDATGSQYDVEVTTSSYGANLTSKSYITIDGLYFNDVNNRWMQLGVSTYNVVQNCKFYDANAGVGIYFGGGSNYNKFIDNVFSDAPLSGDANGTRPYDLVNSTTSGTSFNLFEGNTFGRSAHASIGAYGCDHWVFRGNIFQNTLHTGLGPAENALVEGNYFYDQGSDWESNPILTSPFLYRYKHPGIQLNYPSTIIRENIFDNNGTGIDMSTGYSPYICDHTRVYNNTVHSAVRNTRGEHTYDLPWEGDMDDNIFKNNSFTGAFAVPADGSLGDPYALWFRGYYPGQTVTVNEWYNNNFYSAISEGYRYSGTTDTLANIQSSFTNDFPGATNVQVDPKYTNAAGRDFTLQSASTLIDAGTWLSTITSSSGSGTTFTVDDARYFYDGWGISGETGDVIKTEGGQTGTITSINYGTGQITVSASISVVKDEGIALNYVGIAPDIGAEEYSSPAPGVGIENPTPPDEAEGISTTKDLGWTNGASVTDVDVYFDDADCTTQVVNGVDTETYDTGTMANSDVFYWKIVANPDAENLSFPATGCYTFTTIGTPSDVTGLGFCAGGVDRIYNSGGVDRIYLP